MSGATEPPIRDYRYFTEHAYHHTEDELHSAQLDVNELVGARDEQLEPNEDDWAQWRKLGQTSNLEPNARAAGFTLDFIDGLDDGETQEYFEAGAMNILRIMARRLAPAAATSFRDAIFQMMEPVRTVAINRLVMNIDREEVARCLSTSAATIDFLTEVALSHLEPLVEFRQPYVRPEASGGSYGVLYGWGEEFA